MIIGKGNIASVLIDRDDVTFFAAGVSDSSETSAHQFMREMELMQKQDKERHLVYFSSLSIYRDSNPYNEHKKRMESMVRANFKSYTIVRIEVIAWGKNRTTIHNVFRKKLAEGQPVMISNTFRYVVEKDEFLYWLGLIPVGQKNEMNIPGQRYRVVDILKMVMEDQL